jgi:branched-subunit amino acid aminotransferase/4-amino-4-deoxychorismate lyase
LDDAPPQPNRVLRWTNRGFVDDSGVGEPAVVDSWLVRDGQVRGLELHRARFIAACATHAGVDATVTGNFFDQATRRLPRTGRWFPRVEYVAHPHLTLQLRLRPAPAAGGPAKVAVATLGDPRQYPRIKGPDLAALLDRRAAARRAGADEELLLTPDGLVLEGALSALLWWDGDTLCAPDDALPILDSVTRRLLLDLAERHSLRTRLQRCHPTELAGKETWLASALHGIRPVIEWVGASFDPGEPSRAPRWQGMLRSLARPLPSPGEALSARRA